MSPIPTFDTALEQLRHFLGETGRSPGELLWPSPHGVQTYERRILVWVPIEEDNEWLAQETFEQGREIGIGVCLEVICRLRGSYACKVW